MRTFEAGAKPWLAAIARDLKRPAFERMHPSFVADCALRAYAGHESTYLNNMIRTLDQQQNHEALRDEDDDPCWNLINQAPPGHDVHPDTPITYSTTDERIKVYSGLAVGYLQGKTEYTADLARLTANYFAGLNPAELALTSFYTGEDLTQHFGFGDLDGLSHLIELGKSGKKVADLGMGTHSIIYQNIDKMPVRIALADNNPFTTAFNRTYISLTGRDNVYEVIEADLTQAPKSSGIPQASIDHAGSSLLAHHIFKDHGDKGLEAFARFLWYILPRSGTFRIMDHFESAPFENKFSSILKATGFSLETCAKTPEHQIIDGSK